MADTAIRFLRLVDAELHRRHAEHAPHCDGACFAFGGDARAAATFAVAYALLEERDALRAIVEGRATPPTYPEISAHRGKWLVRYEREGEETTTEVLDFAAARWACTTGSLAYRWWPLDSTGRPCAWPVVTEAPRV